MCEQCVRICNAIKQLSRDEGNSVTIFAANPDFGGPDYAIEVCGDWTNWVSSRYTGRTISEALEKAIEAYHNQY